MTSREDIAAMRRQYGEHGLIEGELPLNPIELFNTWLTQAAENEIVVEANAMVLSTEVDDQPTSRTVLLKDLTEGGFTFFSNYESRKGKQISENKNVSLLFPWYPMERQVIVIGSATKIAREDSEKYFATRPRSSQIGAWASPQSSPLASRAELEQRYEGAAQKWPEGSVVPRPPHWGGYRVTPLTIEFWQGRYSRLHDRLRFERDNTNSTWELNRYYP